MWLGCTPELLHPDAPSFRLKPAALLPERTLRSSLSPSISLLLSSPLVHFHSGDSPWIPRPSSEKSSSTFIFFYYSARMFFQLRRIYHPPPAWKELTPAFQSRASLYCQMVPSQKGANCRKRVNLERKRRRQKNNQREEIPLQ